MTLVETRHSKDLTETETTATHGRAVHEVLPPEGVGFRVAFHVGGNTYREVARNVMPSENPFSEVLRKLKPGEKKNMLAFFTDALDAARTEITEDDLEAHIAEVKPSPAMAAGKASAQAKLDLLDQHPHARLLTAGEMAEYVDKGRNWPSDAARNGRLISARHAAKTYYPAFQIDPVHRETWKWVSIMARLLEDEGTTGRSFVLWAATPSPRFDGDLPAVHTSDPDFLAKAAGDLADL